jgi:hypothetical protein
VRTEAVIGSDIGTVVVYDGSVRAIQAGPPRPLPALLLSSAGQANAFFIEADDPIRYRLLITDEGVPPDLQHIMEPAGGSFLLNIASGQLAAASAEAWGASEEPTTRVSVPAGLYSVRAFSRLPFDSQRYDADMRALLGSRDWTFRKRMDWVGSFGCLLAVTLVPFGLVGSWRWLLGYVASAVFAYWVAYLVLISRRRYRSIERRRARQEASRPHIVIDLRRVPTAEGLAGGGIRV